ncbi:MAG: putative toxin-antitoxin system toxin component, PIN family [Terracidiphilus sp.]
MLRITADSNIYISALNFGGMPDKLLDLARSGVIQVAISEAILSEISRVLRDKFKWAEDAIALALEQISGFTERVNPEHTINLIKDDPTDNRIIECAAAGKSEFLVTGDNHLLKLGQFAGTRILRAAELLNIYEQTERRK